MSRSFVTAQDGRFSAKKRDSLEWAEILERAAKHCEPLYGKISRKAWADISRYGGTHYSFGTRDMQATLLSPAGAPFTLELRSDNEPVSVVIRSKQIEIARHGLPDLFESTIYAVDKKSGGRARVSESFPSQSRESILSRVEVALASEQSDEMAFLLGDTLAARLFGAAVSPERLIYIDNSIAPTSREVNKAAGEISAAAEAFCEVLRRWQGSAALSYLYARTETHAKLTRHFLKASPWQSRVTPEGLISIYSDGFRLASSDIDAVAMRRGKPISGGRGNAVARAIAELWSRCGLGEPKYSAQSRFIKACSVVLPWHGVRKSDYAQFMRAELKKKMSERGVIIS